MKEMTSKGISVVPHKALEGYHGVWIFKRKKRVIFSVRKNLVAEIENKVAALDFIENSVFTNQYINYFFGNKIEKIIGPTFQGYFDSTKMTWTVSENVRKIKFEEYEDILTDFFLQETKKGGNIVILVKITIVFMDIFMMEI